MNQDNLKSLKSQLDDAILELHNLPPSKIITTRTPYDVRGGDVYGGDLETYTTGDKERAAINAKIERLHREISVEEKKVSDEKRANYDVKGDKKSAYEAAKERYKNLSLFQKIPHIIHGTGINSLRTDLMTKRDLDKLFTEGSSRGR